MQTKNLLLVSALVVGIAAVCAKYISDRFDIDFFGGESHSASIVTIDVARILNAQRRFVGADLEKSLDRISYLRRPGKTTWDVIKKVAGPDTIVLVKQSVVVAPGFVPDITDKVLDEMGLDKKVPTIDPIGQLDAGGDTDIGVSNVPASSSAAQERLRRLMHDSMQQDYQEANDALLP